jgi:hypothetical protein
LESPKVKVDIKTALTLGTLLFAIAGFYFTTTSDINALSSKIEGLQTENYDIRRRQNSINKKIVKINKRIGELEK